jgi:hypothetical protein
MASVFTSRNQEQVGQKQQFSGRSGRLARGISSAAELGKKLNEPKSSRKKRGGMNNGLVDEFHF